MDTVTKIATIACIGIGALIWHNRPVSDADQRAERLDSLATAAASYSGAPVITKIAAATVGTNDADENCLLIQEMFLWGAFTQSGVQDPQNDRLYNSLDPDWFLPRINKPVQWFLARAPKNLTTDAQKSAWMLRECVMRLNPVFKR